MSFAQSFDHYVRAAADHTPTIPVYAAGFTAPVWAPSLLQVSQFAGTVTPILVLVLTMLKVYGTAQDWLAKRKTEGKALSMPGKRVVVSVLAAIGVLAAVAWVTTSSAKAAPAVAATVTTSAKKRRRDEDDDEGEPEPDVRGKSRLYALALADLGISETLPNGKPNPIVQAKFAHVKGFNPKTVDCRRVAWCSAEANDLCFRAKVPGTNSAMARSFLYWGKATDDPKPGDIVVFWRGKFNDGQTGHVAVFERMDGAYVVHIGGNQSDAVTRTRTHKSRVLGYRRHMALWESRQMHGAGLQATGGSGFGATAVTDQGTDAPAKATEIAKDTVDSVREPLSQVSEYLPGKWQHYAYVACAALFFVGTAIVVYERYQYRQRIGW